MTRIHFFAGLLTLALAVGCKAQPAPHSPDQTLNRHIEVLVRSQFNMAPGVVVTLGERKPSQFSGFDALPITLSSGSKSQVVDYLISTDGKTLARLDKYDLANDPLFSIDVAGRPVRGNPAAKVTVINFDDLECPYCAQMHRNLFPATQEHYKDLVRFVYKDNPLPAEMHPWAMRAAVDANCLAEQNGGVYWAYVDYLHSHGPEINGPDRNLVNSQAALDRIARQQATLGKLDAARIDACIARQDESQVRVSMREAETLGVEGAPAVFVDGEFIKRGAVPIEELWNVIDRAVRATGVEPPARPQLLTPSALSAN